MKNRLCGFSAVDTAPARDARSSASSAVQLGPATGIDRLQLDEPRADLDASRRAGAVVSFSRVKALSDAIPINADRDAEMGDGHSPDGQRGAAQASTEQRQQAGGDEAGAAGQAEPREQADLRRQQERRDQGGDARRSIPGRKPRQKCDADRGASATAGRSSSTRRGSAPAGPAVR